MPRHGCGSTSPAMEFLSRANRDRDDLVVAGRVELRRSVPEPETGGPPLTKICARSQTDIWAAGGGVRTVSGHHHWYPLLAHWNGQTWQRIKVSGTFTLSGSDPAGDGHCGLWLTTGWDSTGVPPHLIHFPCSQHVPLTLPPHSGTDVGLVCPAYISPATFNLCVG